MKRRVTATRVVALVALTAALLTSPGSLAAPPGRDPRPNVLIIVTDDQRWDAMDHMPETKRVFTRRGTTFTNAFATTPFCCPSRASIMTGKYAHNHGVRTGFEENELPGVQEASIQKALKEAGYKTALFGKYLNAWPLEEDPSYLDRWAVIPHISPNGYYGGRWNVNGELKTIWRYSTTFLRELAIDFIERNERNDGNPWFLYLAPAAPHFPFDTQRRYENAPVTVWPGNPAVAEEDRTDKPVWVQARGTTLTRGQIIRRRQLRTLMSVDDLVAKLFRHLAKLGETNTLAIYTSDNGYMWGEHGVSQKRHPYLPSVRVPYIARWPGYLPTATRDDRIVANIDLAPTIAHATGTPFSGFDGKSWLSGTPRDRLLLEFWKPIGGSGAQQTWASTLTRDYHYTEYYDEAGVLIGQEYYNLLDDPWELENVLGDTDVTNNPSVVEIQELTTQLNEDRSCHGTEECP